MRLIRLDPERGPRVVPDDWRPEDILTLDRLGREDEASSRASGPAPALGVRVDGATDVGALVPHLGRLALVAVEIPRFTDGRAYTLARLLRERHGYEGELRATGDVLREQLVYLRRCGFDAFVLAPGKDLEDALSAFDELRVGYQADVEEPLPIWRRRA